jgi:hypothetical protein
VNSEGVPVARCLCGNPLLPPVPTKTAPKYTGPAWPAFRPSAAVSILPPGALALATPTAAASQATGGPDPLLPGNLLLDGGFEQGLVAPWGTGVYEPRPTIFWGAADADGTVVTDVVHAGKKAFKIVNRTAKKPAIYKTFSQRVTLTKGAPYCLSWWGREDNAAAGLLSLTWEKTFAGRLTMPAGSTTGWGQWAASFNAEDAAVDIRVLSENTGTAWIDEIYLTPGKCVVPNGPVPTLMTAR